MGGLTRCQGVLGAFSDIPVVQFLVALKCGHKAEFYTCSSSLRIATEVGTREDPTSSLCDSCGGLL